MPTKRHIDFEFLIILRGPKNLIKKKSVGPFYPIFWGKMDLVGENLFIQACVWPYSIMFHILDFYENSEEVAKNSIKIFQAFKAKKGVL